MDKRLKCQCVMLGLLTVFPIVMIVMNGSRAVHAILTPVTALQDKGAAMDSTDSTARAKEQKKPAPIQFGVYDPSGEFAADKRLKLRHVYISWASLRRDALVEELHSLEKQGFHIMLTVEPWPMENSNIPVLEGIVQGAYDDIIDELAAALGELKGPIYVAWGHEMDQDLTERYPWSAADPKTYIAAYRRVVERVRGQVDAPLFWIWAGVLKEGSLRYWPGREYVDFVGMPVYSFPAWDRQAYGYIRDFRTTFEEKRRVVAELNMPLMITELGVSGGSDFESFWLHQAFMSLRDYPELAGVVFFYSKDTEEAWGKEVKTPDWRVHPDAVRELVKWNLSHPTRPDDSPPYAPRPRQRGDGRGGASSH